MHGSTTEVIDAAIHISGGQVTVNVEGDGIDSNGSQTYTGGTVTINGPSTYLNNSVDANGELLLNGGEYCGGRQRRRNV